MKVILIFFFFKIIYALILIIGILLSVAYVTLFERKVMGFMQRRRGPNVVGFSGILQPLADGVKLILKETILPFKSSGTIFFLAPVVTFWLSLMGWIVIPFSKEVIYSNIALSIIYIFAISSMAVYGIICGGWGSNSKYPLLGALRSAAQMISYEVSFGLIVMSEIIFDDTANLILVSENQSIWNIFPLFFVFLMFLISILAETNRPPFDLPEAEAELVSGYNVEYSALTFALFFLGEYSSIIIMSSYCVLLFLGGYLPIVFLFSLKILIIIFVFIWVRAAYPRLRYDQLMSMGWKVLLPLVLGYLLFIHGISIIL